MRYRVIEQDDNATVPHLDQVYDTVADQQAFDPAYVETILGKDTDCRWHCDEGKNGPLVQLFLRDDSPHFTKPAAEALAAVPE